jgi:hypothetical protein
MLFTLDNVAEGKDGLRVKTTVWLMARALNMALGALCNIVDLIGQV